MHVDRFVVRYHIHPRNPQMQKRHFIQAIFEFFVNPFLDCMLFGYQQIFFQIINILPVHIMNLRTRTQIIMIQNIWYKRQFFDAIHIRMNEKQRIIATAK